jgi:hypothetical protein
MALMTGISACTVLHTSRAFFRSFPANTAPALGFCSRFDIGGFERTDSPSQEFPAACRAALYQRVSIFDLRPSLCVWPNSDVTLVSLGE